MNDQLIEPLTYDFSGVTFVSGAPPIAQEAGLTEADVRSFSVRLDSFRQEMFADRRLFESGGVIPEDSQPLDAAFWGLPERMLGPDRAILDQILSAADRMADEVDRVVVLGIGGSYMGAQAMYQACCHPYHNELPRDKRSGRPRMYFEGNNVDSDSVASLLELLSGVEKAGGVEGSWGIIVISKSGETLETAVAFRLFLEALQKSCDGDVQMIKRRVIVVTGADSRLRKMAEALGCFDIFPVFDGVGGRFSVLSPVGLLPAAVLGLDVVSLLKGAVAMNDRFRGSSPEDNPVLNYVSVGRLMEVRRRASIRVLSIWGKSLESLGLWYDQLLGESLGKNGQGATPLTVVNTRDLHSRGQQHQEGRRDKLITNLVVRHTSRAPVEVKKLNLNQDNLNELAGKTIKDIMMAAVAGTNKAYFDDYRPAATIEIARVDESALGQLFQMFMLATVVEGYLIGVNPYGQPGVEAYKRNMNEFLRK